MSREHREGDREDSERLGRIEAGIEHLRESISGERGVLARLDGHSDRIRKVERFVFVGKIIFGGAAVACVAAKDIAVEWLKAKIVGPHP